MLLNGNKVVNHFTKTLLSIITAISVHWPCTREQAQVPVSVTTPKIP